MKKALIAVALVAVSVPALAQQKAPEPDYTISGNFGIFSDYRYRGISQTDLRPAVQGGFDFAHKSGFYLGNWNSNIADFTAASSNIEMDFYGGYKFESAGLGFDIGTIYYSYPGATKNPSTSPLEEYDTHEVYLGVSYGPVTFKTSYTVSDGYFGISKGVTFGTGSMSGSAKGTVYYDLSFTKEIAPKTTLSAHVGYLDLDGVQGEFDLTDFRLGIAYDLGPAVIGLTAYSNDIGSNAKANFTNTGEGKRLYKDSVVLSLTKTF